MIHSCPRKVARLGASWADFKAESEQSFMWWLIVLMPVELFARAKSSLKKF